MFCYVTALSCSKWVYFVFFVYNFQTTQKKDSITIHLNVVWPEEKPPLKWEIQLEKALQSWFNKNKSKTECLSLTANEHGSVKVEVSPASGQEDLFTRETELTLKDQTTVSVKRAMLGDLMPPMTNDFDVTSSVTPSAPPVKARLIFSKKLKW
ncbi:hypothetical protein N1851_014687 [Merluccius polli]|uniref:Uncharacterized protein n=1 Tax=Merluccius polli TaxID=89951 RepID=A0AA47MSV0_MERPO|nr:hypothetical protein N1851_014687 [Merluccius polli]